MTAAPEPRRLEPARSAAAEVAADVLVLLKRGRVQVAMQQFERLPELVRDEITDRLGAASWDGYCKGYAAGRAAMAAEIMAEAKPKKPRAQKRHEWLAQRIRDPALRRRVLAVLGIGDADLDVVLSGRAQLSGSQWRRLREVLGS
jgi:hypothetical protein